MVWLEIYNVLRVPQKDKQFVEDGEFYYRRSTIRYVGFFFFPMKLGGLITY